MHVYFMRHGQTNYNLLGLCNDDPAQDVYLTEEGIRQAQTAASELKNEPLELIVTSQLPRTIQTAKIINQFHHVTITQHSSLNDIRSGFDGMPVTDYFAAIAPDPWQLRVNGGESLSDHKARVLGYLEWLKHQPFELVLTIAHEETLRVFAAYFRQIPEQNMLDLHFSNCQILRYSL